MKGVCASVLFSDTEQRLRLKLVPQLPTHQSDELSVQPAEHIGPLLRLRAEHSQPSHQDCCGLLVKCCLYVPELALRICPTDNSRISATLTFGRDQKASFPLRWRNLSPALSSKATQSQTATSVTNHRSFTHVFIYPHVISEGFKSKGKITENFQCSTTYHENRYPKST